MEGLRGSATKHLREGLGLLSVLELIGKRGAGCGAESDDALDLASLCLLVPTSKPDHLPRVMAAASCLSSRSCENSCFCQL